eukprot:COSAG02_NODE_18665_length_926_cov_1.037485_2_plen_29_part_01
MDWSITSAHKKRVEVQAPRALSVYPQAAV